MCEKNRNCKLEFINKMTDTQQPQPSVTTPTKPETTITVPSVKQARINNLVKARKAKAEKLLLLRNSSMKKQKMDDDSDSDSSMEDVDLDEKEVKEYSRKRKQTQDALRDAKRQRLERIRNSTPIYKSVLLNARTSVQQSFPQSVKYFVGFTLAYFFSNWVKSYRRDNDQAANTSDISLYTTDD